MNPAQTKEVDWYAIYTRSRFEKKIYRSLQKLGFQAFLPIVKEKRIWSDRVKMIEAPLFPGYVFVKLEKIQFSSVYLLPGFVRFVSFDGKPCRIREEDISLISNIVESNIKAKQVSDLYIGDFVRITGGPLAGWHGKIQGTLGSTRILFHMDCLQQVIAVEIPSENVEKISEAQIKQHY